MMNKSKTNRNRDKNAPPRKNKQNSPQDNNNISEPLTSRGKVTPPIEEKRSKRSFK